MDPPEHGSCVFPYLLWADLVGLPGAGAREGETRTAVRVKAVLINDARDLGRELGDHVVAEPQSGLRSFLFRHVAQEDHEAAAFEREVLNTHLYREQTAVLASMLRFEPLRAPFHDVPDVRPRLLSCIPHRQIADPQCQRFLGAVAAHPAVRLAVHLDRHRASIEAHACVLGRRRGQTIEYLGHSRQSPCAILGHEQVGHQAADKLPVATKELEGRGRGHADASFEIGETHRVG